MKVKLTDGTFYTLTRYESETIITMNDEDGYAVIGTWQAPMIRKLEKLAAAHPKEVVADVRPNQQPEYRVPKAWIKVSAPRQLSAESKQKLSERMKALHQN